MVRSSASGSVDPTATRHRAYRIGAPRGEWQCDRYARGRVAVHLTLPLGGERTGRRIPHCHSASSVPRRHDQGRVAVRPHCHSAVNVRDGTFKCEWQCRPHCHSASSVPYWYAQGRVAVRSVRSGASGSASSLPLGGERTGRRIPHCHSAVNVRGSATLNLRGSRRGSQEGSRRGSQLQANDKGRPRVLRDLPPLDHTSARQASLPCAR